MGIMKLKELCRIIWWHLSFWTIVVPAFLICGMVLKINEIIKKIK
jgi:hypothetical protein